jgi:hypothetical protein
MAATAKREWVPAALRPDVELSMQGPVRSESLLSAFPGLNLPTGQLAEWLAIVHKVGSGQPRVPSSQ